jgi:hypothetical protein
MSQEKISELISVKKETEDVEERIQEIFTTFTRRGKTEYSKPNDYMERCFHLPVYFDMLSIDNVEKNLDELKKLSERYQNLRKRQKNIEGDVDISNSILNTIQDTVNLGGF